MVETRCSFEGGGRKKRKEGRKKLVRMNLKSLPLEEKGSGNEMVGIFLEEGTFAI